MVFTLRKEAELGMCITSMTNGFFEYLPCESAMRRIGELERATGVEAHIIIINTYLAKMGEGLVHSIVEHKEPGNQLAQTDFLFQTLQEVSRLIEQSNIPLKMTVERLDVSILLNQYIGRVAEEPGILESLLSYIKKMDKLAGKPDLYAGHEE